MNRIISWSILSLINFSQGCNFTRQLYPLNISSSPTSEWVSPGSTAEFHCTATGSPPPTYAWRKTDSHELPSKVEGRFDPHLLIPDVTEEDEGKYYCIASNDLTTLHSTKAWLRITDEPPDSLDSLVPRGLVAKNHSSTTPNPDLLLPSTTAKSYRPPIVVVVAPAVAAALCLLILLATIATICLVRQRRKRKTYVVNPGRRHHTGGLPHVFVKAPPNEEYKKLPRRWRDDKSRASSLLLADDIDYNLDLE